MSGLSIFFFLIFRPSTSQLGGRKTTDNGENFFLIFFCYPNQSTLLMDTTFQVLWHNFLKRNPHMQNIKLLMNIWCALDVDYHLRFSLHFPSFQIFCSFFNFPRWVFRISRDICEFSSIFSVFRESCGISQESWIFRDVCGFTGMNFPLFS